MNFLVEYLKSFMYVTMLAMNKDMPFFNICILFIFFCLNIISKTSSPTMKINGHSEFLYLNPEFSVNSLLRMMLTIIVFNELLKRNRVLNWELKMMGICGRSWKWHQSVDMIEIYHTHTLKS